MDHNEKKFNQQLINNINEFITLIIKSGENGCIKKGVLSQVEDDYLILINNDFKIEVPLDAIIAFKKRLKNKIYKG